LKENELFVFEAALERIAVRCGVFLGKGELWRPVSEIDGEIKLATYAKVVELGSFDLIPYFANVEYKDFIVLLRFGGGGLSELVSLMLTALSRM